MHFLCFCLFSRSGSEDADVCQSGLCGPAHGSHAR